MFKRRRIRHLYHPRPDNIINAQLPITLDEIATILGITSAEIPLENLIKLTLDVDTMRLLSKSFDIGIIEWEEPSKLLMRLELCPKSVKI